MKLVAENGVEYLINKPRLTIGRGPDNDIKLTSELKVSRNHATIHATTDQCHIEDLKSTNGTFVNGHAIRGFHPLQHGDRIMFGVTEFTFLMDIEESPASPAAPAPARHDAARQQVTGPLSTERLKESHNRGTRIVTLLEANEFWSGQLAQGQIHPFLQYRFRNSDNAYQAMLTLPMLYVAHDTRMLIATEPFYFGVYALAADSYEAVLYGENLSYPLWQMAKEEFERYGGLKVNERMPEIQEPIPPPLQKTSPLGDVTFLREERRYIQPGTEALDRIYQADTREAAMAFLDQNPVDQPYDRIIVITPEGSFGRNYRGYFQE